MVPARALVAHPDLGYPPIDDGSDAPDPVVDAVVAALREEPRTDFASAAELDQFIADAGRLEDRYRQMIDTLERAGVAVIRFAGVDNRETSANLRALTRNFADFGLKILGPKEAHVLRCTEVIEEETRRAARAARSQRHRDSGADAVSLYRLLSGMNANADSTMPDDVAAFLDRPGKGAALNDQSIVLKVVDGELAALLTGDMQLAKAEVRDLDDDMSALLATIGENGPYAFVKLAHHASYNGFDETVAEALASTSVYGVSTGRGDPGHPEAGVLDLLKSMDRSVRWVRTDKNGGITITLADGNVELDTARGRLNDTGINRKDDAAPPPVPAGENPHRSSAPVAPRPFVHTQTRRADDVVEVTARIPHAKTRVTITVDIQPDTADIGSRGSSPPGPPPPAPQPDPRPASALGGGRALPPLLFITSRERLSRNIGAEEAERALGLIDRAGQHLLDLPDYANPMPATRAAFAQRTYEGVVILGGYDVVRSWRYDTLPPTLRQRMGANDDPDDFVVWSDQVYGDKDGDGLGEIPVSRIPDGHYAPLIGAALSSGPAAGSATRFGLRNVARPFASGVYNRIAGNQAMLVSEPSKSQNFNPAPSLGNSAYFMLHGSDSDTSMFWGELARGGLLDAFSVDGIPSKFSGVVFAGCCWGALPARVIAARYREGATVPIVGPDQSIALGFLLSGAWAFVGCTGAHYSPVAVEGNPLNFYGGPMHEAFWERIGRGDPPAKALFGAKLDYISGMPHGRRTVEEQAIEHKILRQFTCLGLGW